MADIAKDKNIVARVCCRFGDYSIHWNDNNKDVAALLKYLDADDCDLSAAIKTHEKHHHEQLKKVCGSEFCKGKDSADGKITSVLPPSSQGCIEMMECFARLAGLNYALAKGLSYDPATAKGKKCCRKALELVRADIAAMRDIPCTSQILQLVDTKKVQQLEKCCK